RAEPGGDAVDRSLSMRKRLHMPAACLHRSDGRGRQRHVFAMPRDVDNVALSQRLAGELDRHGSRSWAAYLSKISFARSVSGPGAPAYSDESMAPMAWMRRVLDVKNASRAIRSRLLGCGALRTTTASAC